MQQQIEKMKLVSLWDTDCIIRVVVVLGIARERVHKSRERYERRKKRGGDEKKKRREIKSVHVVCQWVDGNREREPRRTRNDGLVMSCCMYEWLFVA